MTAAPAHILTRLENTPANAQKVAEILVQAFEDDPVINTFVEPIRDPVARRRFREDTWFQVLILAASLNECEMYEVDDWKGVSVWMPPNKDVGNPWTMVPAGLFRVLWGLGVRGVARMLGPGQTVMDPFKKQAGCKGPEGFWYCFFVAVLPEHQGQGLSLPLMSPHTPTPSSPYPLSPSHTPQHPTWLEATTPRSRALYERLGYTLIGEGRIAVGSVDESGMTKKGGEGVPMWGMVVPALDEKAGK